MTHGLEVMRAMSEKASEAGTLVNIHTTTVHAKCPINGQWDYYKLTVKTKEFVKCEDIDAVANSVRSSSMTQEQIADKIKANMPESCRVFLEGQHGQNQGLVTIR